MNDYDTSVETGRRHYYSSLQGPFYNANNIFMFYGGGERGATVENIITSLQSDEQIIQVHGERGSGKTMLSLVISDRLKLRYNVIRYDIPEVSPSLLLRHLLIELCPQQADLISAQMAQAGVDEQAVDTALDTLVEQLSERSHPLLEKPYILLMDTAGELDQKTLGILERLSQLRRAGRLLMHCVVFRRVKQSPGCSAEVRQTRNHYWLRRLTLAEVNEYLHHHMMLFDFNRRDLFTREMTYFVADRSEGIFRSINTLARNAFTIASLEDADKLSMSHLLMAGLPQRPEPSTESGFLVKHRAGLIAFMGCCVVASTAATVFLLR